MSFRSCKTEPADIVAISTALEDNGRQDKNLHHATGASDGAAAVFSHQMVRRDEAQRADGNSGS